MDKHQTENPAGKAIHHFKVVGLLVPFPLEYALYRIPVSPARHSRASGNPELEVTFQYRQDHLETVLEGVNFTSLYKVLVFGVGDEVGGGEFHYPFRFQLGDNAVN